MEIQSVRKRAEDSVTVLFTDGSSLVAPLESAIKFGLRRGDTLTPDTLAALRHSSALYAVREAALQYLTRREHTAFELRNKLIKKKFPKEDIAPVITELLQKGFINDEIFANKFIAHRLHQRKVGPMKIRQELMKRGVARAIIDEALRGAEISDVPSDELLPLARKKAAVFARRGVSGRDLSARLFRFLAGRGYTTAQIKNVITQVTGAFPEEE